MNEVQPTVTGPIIHGLPKVFADTSLPIVVEDLDGRVISMNPAAEEAYGWQADELMGLPIKTIVPKSHHQQADELLTLCRSGEIVRDIEGLRHRKNGTLVPVLLTLSLLTDERGVQSIASMATDIGPLKEAERRLRASQDTLELRVSERTSELESALQELEVARRTADQANVAKSQFLANISHEIRTPMNAILGMTHLCLETELSRKQRSFLQRIERSAKDLLGLVNDILDFSKIEAGGLKLEQTTFTLDSILEKQRDLFATPAAAKNVELLFRVEPKTPTLLVGDPLRLGQVLTNLLSNALKFTEQGQVLVSVSSSNTNDTQARLRFSVSDTGIGIEEIMVEKIFESFRQVDASTTRKFGGTGLGLAICQQLVQLMSGQLGAHSKTGKGSEFWFEIDLPVLEDRRSDERLPTGRALILESQLESANSLELLFRALGWEVVSYQSAGEVIREVGRPEDFQVMLISDRDNINLEALISHLEKSSVSCPILTLVPSLDKSPPSLGLNGLVVQRPLTRSLLYNRLEEVLQEKTQESALAIRRPARLSDEYPELKGLQALVVEDNAINRDVLREMLKNVGVVSFEASRGEEALSLVAGQSFDIILMDIQMPGIDGREATRLIRKRGCLTPIVAVTANVSSSDIEGYKRDGMNGFLAKPIEPQELYLILERFRGNKACLDKEMALRLLQGNEDLYHKLINRFFRETKPSIEGWHQLEIPQIQRQAHSISSSAGTLGMRKVATLGKAIEKHSTKDNCLQTLVTNLAEAVEEARILYACRRNRSAQQVARPTEGELHLEVDEFLAALDACDVTAATMLRNGLNHMSEQERTQWSELLPLLDDYDFPAASEWVRARLR